MLAVLAAAVLAVGAAPTASAAPPDVGDHCYNGLLNNTTTNINGVAIRCMADNDVGYVWVVDNGQPDQSPWVADQIAWAACQKQGYSDSECRMILDGGDAA